MDMIQQQNPDGTWSEAIPEPGWHRSWRTLFRWRPECWDCGRNVGSTIPRFRTRGQYEAHWRSCHGHPPKRAAERR